MPTELPPFDYGPIETPYQKAKQEWDNRIGLANVQAKNWRFVSILSLIINIILALATILLIANNKPLIYIAEVSSKGEVIHIKPLYKAYNPSQAQHEYIIAQFIANTMNLPLDPVILKQNWLTAYQFTQGQAQRQFSELAAKQDAFNKVGKITRTTEIRNIASLTPASYAAEWIQTTYNAQGKVTYIQSYRGIFTTSYRTPKTQKEILINPLGIHIEYFTITEL